MHLTWVKGAAHDGNRGARIRLERELGQIKMSIKKEEKWIIKSFRSYNWQYFIFILVTLVMLLFRLAKSPCSSKEFVKDPFYKKCKQNTL